MDHPTVFSLEVLPGELAVCRLPPRAEIPAWVRHTHFISITRTPEELSIVCDQSGVPGTVEAATGWRALRVQGPLAFELIGVLAAIVNPLAQAGVSVFAISTYDTDYILVRQVVLPAAAQALRAAGHVVSGQVENG